MLYALAQEKCFRPVKYFSIDRVFRNEALDATHLAEFHQIEGVIADYDLSLGDLIGTLETFFKKLGAAFSLLLLLFLFPPSKRLGHSESLSPSFSQA